jgi:phage tail tape-measure protein
MNNTFKHSIVAGAVALALGSSGLVLANDTTKTQATTTTEQPMTDKQKATAIGAGTGAVAGAVVGGPVGAVVGAGVGAYVGNKGTDANGKVDANNTSSKHASTSFHSDDSVRKAQVALNGHGYSLSVDGVKGPATEHALRDFQAKQGLTATGRLDSETMNKLGVNS